jgi:hypothetical protein
MLKRLQHCSGSLVKRLSLLLLLLLLNTVPYAQDETGPGDGGLDGNPDGGSVPIDGGLGLLLAAGVGYSVKKIRDYRKMKEEEEA